MARVALPDHLRELRIETIGDLDAGAFGMLCNSYLKTILNDLRNRPASGGGKPEKRKLRVELEFIPRVEINKATRQVELTEIIVQPTASVVLPKGKGDANILREKSGMVLFNCECPTDFEQPPLPLDGHDDDDE